MINENIILRCEDSIEGMFTAVYDAFVYKNKIQKENNILYNDTISIEIGQGENYTLFSTIIDVNTDLVKSKKTVSTIKSRLGENIYGNVFNALCHYDADRATVVLGFLVRAFKVGQRITEYMSDEYVIRTYEMARKVNNEGQKLNGFLRFSDNGSFLLSKIAPKCNMIPIIMWHFQDRFPGENFVIYDQIRKYAVIHPKGRGCFFISNEQFMQLEENIPQQMDIFENLWKIYFESTDIRERFDEHCQINMCPKWYRKNMSEFEEKAI